MYVLVTMAGRCKACRILGRSGTKTLVPNPTYEMYVCVLTVSCFSRWARSLHFAILHPRKHWPTTFKRFNDSELILCLKEQEDSVHNHMKKTVCI
jgi:hypothetical protein